MHTYQAGAKGSRGLLSQVELCMGVGDVAVLGVMALCHAVPISGAVEEVTVSRPSGLRLSLLESE